MARAITPFIVACRAGQKTFVAGHHNRKGGGEHGEAIAGGHALLGVFDIALELLRDHAPNRRVVKPLARLIQPPPLLYERDKDGLLVALGDPAGVTLEEVRRVVEVLGEEWKKTAEVRGLLEEPRPGAEIVRQALLAEARGGAVERDPDIDVQAVAGKTVRWRMRPTFPHET
jgi:hypothetical protein